MIERGGDMLFLDIIDIIYFIVGIVVGVILTTVVDSMICNDCKERRNNE